MIILYNKRHKSKSGNIINTQRLVKGKKNI